MRLKLVLFTVIALLAVMTQASAQNPQAALASLPEADVLIYLSPQRILSEAAPRVVPAKEIESMRSGFAEMKKSIGVDPAAIEYVVLAVRFHKPAGDLSFVAPDVMAVIGGDFSSDSLMTLGQVYMQDKVRTEKHGSKTITLMKIILASTEFRYWPDAFACGISESAEIRRQDETCARMPLSLPSSPR